MMVMGVRTKNRRSSSVQLDYLIHIQEVKPWPPSQSLKTLRSVLIQWEHGDRNSGSTKPVVPSIGSSIGEGKIEFSESFRLPVTLLRQMSAKGGDGDAYQKNCLEFNLYELRRDNTVKGQLLGTAIVDLAEYGIIKETLTISVPLNSMRSFSNTVQPFLFVNIQSIEKGRTVSSSRDHLFKEPSLQKNSAESVSTLMNEEYVEDAEITSITDDDVSSHSSLVVSSSAFETNDGLSPHSEENGLQTMKPLNEQRESSKVSSSCSSSTDSSSNVGSLENGHATLANFRETSLTSIPKKTATLSVQSSSSSITYEGAEEEVNNNTRTRDYGISMHEVANGGSEIGSGFVQQCNGGKSSGPSGSQVDEKSIIAISVESQVNREDSGKDLISSTDVVFRAASADILRNGRAQVIQEEQHCREDETGNRLSHGDTRRQVSPGSDALSFSGDNLAVNILNGDRLKHVKSVRSPLDSGKSNGSVRSSKLGDAQSGPQGFVSKERKDTRVNAKETRNITSDGRIQQLEHRITMLEGELRDAAAIEVGLYSVVADHGSSMNKVHAPARRLSRLYLHACKESPPSRRENAARSAVSGLVLVIKACGNDVPRLTFWLSNSVVLRAIISQAFAEEQLPISARLSTGRTGSGNGNHQKLSPLQWKDSSPGKETKGPLCESFDDWEDPLTFSSALGKIEAWIFSRIIESVWWQTLTPYMQSAAAKAISTGMVSEVSNTYQRASSAVDEEVQLNLSLELWKKAFKDACERICPVRAEGHECGCLPVLAKLIMEQCVARLDVAMFNAILRESDDEIPTDPISDPISDTKVLPIPAGKASFGAGAQLKTAVGNWSRWLTDLFGIDDDDSHEDKNDQYNDDDDHTDIEDHDTSKSFHLLNALSDLMMLPKDMLLSRSIRKEVCPTFGVPLIKRVLNNFVPDEFCPDPIPNVVLEALDSEDPLEDGDGLITEFPCSAASIVYLPPPAASVAGIAGETGSQSQLRRSGSSVLKKSYTSDDELDELDSPLSSIIETFQASPTPAKPRCTSKENGSRNAVRYQLLREVWMNSE